jgi:hypothetical protein
MTEPARPTFVIKLQASAGVDAVWALRAVLKALLRRHGMRAVSVREEP